MTGQISWKKTASISSLLIAACLISGGFLTDTFLGFEESPSEAYRQEIKTFENAVANVHRQRKLANDEQQRLDQYREDMSRILETAKHPFSRWVSIALVVALLVFASVTSTTMSLLFTAKTIKAVASTAEPLLVAGAIFLNGAVLLVIFLVELVALSIASSVLILLLFSFAGILFELGPLWGVVGFSGYGIFAWITAPIWLKSLASASLVPFLLVVLSAGLTVVLFPIRKPLILFLRSLLHRAGSNRDGPIAFFAYSFFCLSAAITAATALIN